jgi:hypothetical protein
LATETYPTLNPQEAFAVRNLGAISVVEVLVAVTLSLSVACTTFLGSTLKPPPALALEIHRFTAVCSDLEKWKRKSEQWWPLW